MVIIGGVLGGLLGLSGGLLNSVGMVVGLDLQNIMATGGDLAKNIMVILGGTMGNLVVGMTSDGGEDLTQNLSLSGIKTTDVTTGQLGTI